MNEKKYERGNVIDQIGSVLVMAFIFAMLLAFAAYGRMTQAKLALDNVAKEYLYKMEEYGYLKAEDEESMKADFASAVQLSEIPTPVDVGASTTRAQVAYGDKITLDVTVAFQNPLYTVFSTEGAMFNIFGFEKDIYYNIRMSATSKW